MARRAGFATAALPGLSHASDPHSAGSALGICHREFCFAECAPAAPLVRPSTGAAAGKGAACALTAAPLGEWACEPAAGAAGGPAASYQLAADDDEEAVAIAVQQRPAVLGAEPPDVFCHHPNFPDCGPPGLLPLLSLGSVFLPTRKGPLFSELLVSFVAGARIPQETWRRVWGPGSLLYGKHVFWASRHAAAAATRRRGFPSRRQQARATPPASSTEGGLDADEAAAAQAGGDSSPGQPGWRRPRSLFTWLLEEAAQCLPHWRCHRLPPRLPLPWRRGGGGQQQRRPLSFDQASSMDELRLALGLKAAACRWAVEVPLASALEFLRMRGLRGLTLCPPADEVLWERRPWGTAPLARGGSLPVFRLPGVCLVLPSPLGWVHFQPCFLSRRELLAAWAVARRLRRRVLLQQRAAKRRAAIAQLRAAAAAWATAPTGPGEPPVDAAEAGGQGGDQPPEVRELLQEMGVPQPGGGGGGGGGRAGPAALQPLGVLAAGGVGVVTSAVAALGAAADRLMLSFPAGYRLLKQPQMPAQPRVQAAPLKQLLGELRQHNAAALEQRSQPAEPSQALEASAQAAEPGASAAAAQAPLAPAACLPASCTLALALPSKAARLPVSRSLRSLSSTECCRCLQEGAGPPAAEGQQQQAAAEGKRRRLFFKVSKQRPARGGESDGSEGEEQLGPQLRDWFLGLVQHTERQQRLLSQLLAGGSVPASELPGAGMAPDAARAAFLPFLSRVAGTMAQDALVEGCSLGVGPSTVTSTLAALEASPGGRLHWFVGVPQPQLLPPAEAASKTAGGFAGSELQPGGFSLALVQLDLQQATGAAPPDPPPPGMLRGLLLCGEIGWQAGERSCLPDRVFIGCSNGCWLESPGVEWP